jgi:hypothetical protein
MVYRDEQELPRWTRVTRSRVDNKAPAADRYVKSDGDQTLCVRATAIKQFMAVHSHCMRCCADARVLQAKVTKQGHNLYTC